jgi:HlyD family secretion protein
MVSADGAPVTPEDPRDPGSGHGSETKQAVAETGVRARSPEQRGGTPSSRPRAPGVAAPASDRDASRESAQEARQRSDETPAGRGPGKKKLSRRQRKINRLVMEFQPDAVEMEHRKVAGGLRWTLYAVILLMIAAISWAWWARVDRVVTAQGKLIAVARTFVINAPQTSPIRSFNVKFGDTVRAGQALVTLDPTFSEADVNKLETRLNALDAETLRLEAEQQDSEFRIEGHETDPVWINQQILFLDRRRQREAARQEYEAEIRKLEAQKDKDIAEVQSRRDLVEHREETLRQNEDLYRKQAGSLDAVRDARIELKYARNNLLTAEKTVTETEAQFTVLERRHESEKAREKAAVSLELAQKRQEKKEVEEDLNKARRANELVVLYAPTEYEEYKVVEIADPSSVVNPGQPIMKLIPADSPLELEVKVDSKDIALIRDTRDGQPRKVRIKISAFPYMKHGTLLGFVKTINADITEEGQPGMTRAFYYVRVRFDDSPEALALRNIPEGEERYLRPGMEATGEIKVGRRRVIDFFIYPLFRSLDTSIREP